MVGKPIKTAKKVEVKKQSNVEKAPSLVLQDLEREEAALMREKQDLATLEERLQAKAREEIEVKEQNIQTLKCEISELKRLCEEIESSLGILELPI